MNVDLTPEQEQMIESQVKTGRYHSTTEVLSEALRMMEKRDRVREDIRQKIEAGLESARAGRLIDGEAFFAQMDAELEEEIRAEEERAEMERTGHP